MKTPLVIKSYWRIIKKEYKGFGWDGEKHTYTDYDSICDNCRSTPAFDSKEEYWYTDYCPSCGAKMTNKKDKDGYMILEELRPK